MAESTRNIGDTDPIDHLSLPRDGADGRFFLNEVELVLLQRVVLDDLGLNLTQSLWDPPTTFEEVGSLYKEMDGWSADELVDRYNKSVKHLIGVEPHIVFMRDHMLPRCACCSSPNSRTHGPGPSMPCPTRTSARMRSTRRPTPCISVAMGSRTSCVIRMWVSIRSVGWSRCSHWTYAVQSNALEGGGHDDCCFI